MSSSYYLDEIKTLPQWVCYSLAWDAVRGKSRKIPLNPHNGKPAEANNPDSWASYDEAVNYAMLKGLIAGNSGGVGFEFDTGYAGIDLDDCFDDAGHLTDWASEIVAIMSSYTEISPSGKGLHILFSHNESQETLQEMLGAKFGTRRGQVELYYGRHFFTVTERIFGDPKPIAERTNEARQVFAKYLAKPKPEQRTERPEYTPHATPQTITTNQLWEIMFHSANGARIQRLFNGDCSEFGNDHSRADQALCNHLAFFCANDYQRIDEMFRNSGLMRPKWDEIHGDQTYGAMTIASAISGTSTAYDPEYGRRGKQTTSGTNNCGCPQGDCATAGKFSKLQALLVPFDTTRPIKRTEFIGGLYPRGYVTFLVAHPGCGKSLTVQQSFSDLSKGGLFLGGFSQNEPPRKCLILAGELGVHGYIERAQTFTGFDHNPENTTILDQLECENSGISLTPEEKEGQENLSFLAGRGYDIMFIDSFSAFSIAKETDNSELKKTLLFFNQLAKINDIAIVVTHHIRKRLSSEQEKPLALDDVIGGNVMTRFVHTVIALEYVRKLDQKRFSCLKSWGKGFKPFAFTIDKGLYGAPSLFFNLDPGEIDVDKLKGGSSNTPDFKEVIKIFLKGRGQIGATNQEINAILERDAGGQKLTNAQLKRLVDEGVLIKAKRGLFALPESEIFSEKTTDTEAEDTE